MSTTGPQPPTASQGNQLGLLSLVLGTLSIPLVFCYALGLPAGIAAVVLGVLELRRVRAGRGGSRRQALVGLTCGAIAATLMVIVILLPN